MFHFIWFTGFLENKNQKAFKNILRSKNRTKTTEAEKELKLLETRYGLGFRSSLLGCLSLVIALWPK